MRGKLIELLDNAIAEKELRGSDGELISTFPFKAIEDGMGEWLADYLIAHGVTVQEWIPVSERLPEDSGLTLVRVDFSMWDKKVNVPSLERYVNEEKAWFCDGAKLTNITHWMPLPAAPKEVK